MLECEWCKCVSVVLTGLTKDDVIQITHDYFGPDMKDLSTAVSTLDDENQKNKAKVNSIVYHVDNEAKKSETKNEEIERRIQKFQSLTRVALDIFTMSSYLGSLIAVGIGLGLDTSDGKSVFDFLIMLSSLLIFGFVKQFPDLTTDMCICCRKSYQAEDIWIFHRIRNTILSNVTTVVSLLVDFGEINIVASVLCYCGALLCVLTLAYYTLQNINEIHKLLKILGGIAEGDIVTAEILERVTVAFGRPPNSKLVESLDRMARQNCNSDVTNGSNGTIANQAARIKIKYTK